MDNRFFINKELLYDEETQLTYFYLNKSPYHRRHQAYMEEESKGVSDDKKLYQLEKKF